MEYISVITRTDEILNALCESFKCKKSSTAISLPKGKSAGIKLSDIIGSYFENRIILKVLNSYEEYTRTEKIDIYKKLIKENPARIRHLRYIINSNLDDYLKNNDTLIIEGFVNFRLKEYEDKIVELIEETAECYFLEKEYEEFIEMIKLYINYQKPLIDLIHVHAANNSYSLVAEDGTDVTDVYTEDIINEKRLFAYTKEDILLSALIGIAPKKIIFHKSVKNENEQFTETLKKIFCNRISFAEDF